MTAIVLPDIDFDELKKRIPALSDIELPSMQQAGKKADETIDRVLGRSGTPIWPWIAGFVVIAVIGSIAALFGWNHRSSATESTGITPTEASLMSTPAADL